MQPRLLAFQLGVICLSGFQPCALLTAQLQPSLFLPYAVYRLRNCLEILMHNFQHRLLNPYCGVNGLTVAFLSFNRTIIAAINRAGVGMIGALLCTAAADQPMSAMSAIQQPGKQRCAVHAGLGGRILCLILLHGGRTSKGPAP